jgi:hypothetical protein
MKNTESESRKTPAEIFAREEFKFTAFLVVKFVVVYIALSVTGAWVNHYYGMLAMVIFDLAVFDAISYILDLIFKYKTPTVTRYIIDAVSKCKLRHANAKRK